MRRFNARVEHAARFQRFARPFVLAASIALAFASMPAPVQAALGVADSLCVQALPGGGNCVSEDLQFQLIGLGIQDDGCVNTNDTLTIRLGATVQNVSAQTRYDVGIFVDENGVSAKSGTNCVSEALHLANGTELPAGCPPSADLSNGAGPYLNNDGDWCGDIRDGCTDSFIIFTEAVTVPCKSLPTSTGFEGLAVCLTWGNTANQVGDVVLPTGTCDNEDDLHAGTDAKCRCNDNLASNVPLPNLSLSCSCARVGLTDDFDCSVAYTNDIFPLAPTIGTCTNPVPTPANRFRCGTASFIQFQLDNTASQIDTITPLGFNLGLPDAGPFDDAYLLAPRGSDSYNSGTQELYWNPESSALGDSNTTAEPNDGADNIISADDFATYSYRVTLDTDCSGPSPCVLPGDSVQNIWRTAWSDGSGGPTGVSTNTGAPSYALNPAVLQNIASVTADCSFKFEATWAAVTAVTAYKERGKTIVEWRTAGESSSLAFDLYRIDPVSGRETRVNPRKLVAVRQAPGGLYRIVDPGAHGDTLRYRIVESDLSGSEKSYGPYDIQIAPHPGGRPPMGNTTSSALLAGYPSGSTARARSASAPVAEGVPSGKAKILVDSQGMVSVSADELASAIGVSAGDVGTAIGAGTFRMQQGGADIAWVAEAANAGVRFFAEPPSGVTAPKNVYWASIDLTPLQVQMSTKKSSAKSGKPVSSFVATALFEQNLEPRPEGFQDPDADWWLWKVVAPGVIANATVPLNLAGLVSGSSSLVVELFGFPTTSADGEYRASVTLNNTLLGEASWRLPNRYRAAFVLPAGLLVNGANTLKIGAVKGVVLLDAAEVTHHRSFQVENDRLEFVAESTTAIRVTGLSSADSTIYDITARRAPSRLTGVSITDAGNGTFSALFRPTTGHRYLAAGPNGFIARELANDSTVDLRNPLNAADYVVITDAALWSGAQALASFRSSTGFTTLVVDVQEIYDEFSHGLLDPRAMRSFLRYAVENWQTAPTHVVLAGKGTWDHRDLFAAGDNFVPPILVGSVLGLVGSDTAIVDFDNDGTPELSIGRVPAISNAELDDYVAKLETYEANPGAWRDRAIALADNGDGVAGFFATDSTAIEGLLAAEGLTVVPIHLPGSSAANVTATRSALFSELSTGALVLNFVGHGGFDLLADEGLLKITDVVNLANAGRLPLFVTETCYVGYFTFPGYAALSEHLLLTADVGTIANWSPAGLSANNPAVVLGGDIAARIAAPGSGTLGERVRAAIAAYLAGGGSRSNTNPYNLLGDPAIEPN